jgi:hypothetical protein
VDEQLSLCTCGGEDVWAKGVKLDGLNGAGVLVDYLDLSIAAELQYMNNKRGLG